MNSKVYDIVTGKIIEQLENGVIPWKKPWGLTGSGELPKNGITGRHYSGINLLMLEWGESYYTWTQIQEQNKSCKDPKDRWHLKKGSKASIIVFFTVMEKEGKNEDPDRIPVIRYYNVFKSSDIEGCPQPEKRKHNTIEEAEAILRNFTEVPIYHHNDNRAFYSPMEDYINVPEMSRFEVPEEYYCTLFHEMAHSTGHVSRLKRFVGPALNASFGSKLYSFEELIAELGASFLCGVCGIEQKTLENSAAYIDSWIKVLKEDNKIIVKAAAKAQKAADYIQEGNHDKVPSANRPKDTKPVSKRRPHFNKEGLYIG
jgi:antirestriction protein ArdC